MNVPSKITLKMSGFLNKHYPFIKVLKMLSVLTVIFSSYMSPEHFSGLTCAPL